MNLRNLFKSRYVIALERRVTNLEHHMTNTREAVTESTRLRIGKPQYHRFDHTDTRPYIQMDKAVKMLAEKAGLKFAYVAETPSKIILDTTE